MDQQPVNTQQKPGAPGVAWILCEDELILSALTRREKHAGERPWTKTGDDLWERDLRREDASLSALRATLFERRDVLDGKSPPELVLVVGLCTGRWAKTNTGDLVISERVFAFDPDVIRADEQAAARSSGKVNEVGRRLPKATKRAIESVDWENESKKSYETHSSGKSSSTGKEIETQQRWMVTSMHRFESGRGPNPVTHPERNKYCPDWSNLLPGLRELGLVMPRRLALTPQGHTKAREWGGVIDARTVMNLAYRVHVGPTASSIGSGTVDDPELFVRLNLTSKKLLALDTGLGARNADWGGYPNTPMLLCLGVSNIAGIASSAQVLADARDAIAAFVLDYLLRF